MGVEPRRLRQPPKCPLAAGSKELLGQLLRDLVDRVVAANKGDEDVEHAIGDAQVLVQDVLEELALLQRHRFPQFVAQDLTVFAQVLTRPASKPIPDRPLSQKPHQLVAQLH